MSDHSKATMSIFFVLASSFTLVTRCHTHYPVAVIDDYPPIGIAALPETYPYLAVAPEAIMVAPSRLPVSVVEESPVMAPSPFVVAKHLVAPVPMMAPASAPMMAPAPLLPYALYNHHYHPQIDVRNAVRSYTKDNGHVSDTVKRDFPTLLGAAFQEKLFDVKKATKASSEKSQS
ncbi:hypothetical protein Y032_0002g885 [Ancylostoma ceylanicum]|uniref:Uncharacterized protein n=2 Tax=Ancylostoma ceylanicum TaxID=53326 RepID=A0A016W205_9BILA|nr:hypothetical protein Y032_0002g885 [Ancylostoma ceylanicum]